LYYNRYGNKNTPSKAVNLHLQGIIEHGKKFVAYLTYNNINTGSNLAVHTFLLQLSLRYNESNKKLPDLIYYQIDGGSENANKTILAICELLIARGLTKKIVVTRLPPGHTHEDIDGRFGVIWRDLVKRYINTPPG
jgi:hypothetical protein